MLSLLNPLNDESYRGFINSTLHALCQKPSAPCRMVDDTRRMSTNARAAIARKARLCPSDDPHLDHLHDLCNDFSRMTRSFSQSGAFNHSRRIRVVATRRDNVRNRCFYRCHAALFTAASSPARDCELGVLQRWQKISDSRGGLRQIYCRLAILLGRVVRL